MVADGRKREPQKVRARGEVIATVLIVLMRGVLLAVGIGLALLVVGVLSIFRSCGVGH